MSFLMYLRKSRADNPDESVEEVLSKHERILQDFCLRQYGAEIPEADIYREVVSGESIADRVEIRKVLTRIEDSRITGVIVVEPQRLSRGDLVDCGTLINAFQYTGTRVITPVMTYDLSNKFERRYFQDELLRGRDYLEYTKEILMRGKIAAVNRGCYLQSVPPYGYDRIRIGKDFTLTPNSDSENVRLIFDLFCAGSSSWQICRRFDSLGIPTPSGASGWKTATVDKILRNRHYIGQITYQRDKTTVLVIDGQKTAKRLRQKEGQYISAEGKHPAIISPETFEKAQSLLSLRPPVLHDKILRNAFAGILYCARCGKLMLYKDKNSANDIRMLSGRYICCKTPGCSKSVPYDRMLSVVTEALEKSQLPDLQARLSSGEETAAEIRKKMLKNLEKEIEDLHDQEDVQYEMLEKKQYSPEVFSRRNQVLRDRLAAAETQRDELIRCIPAAVNYEAKIVSLTAAISALRDGSATPSDQNLLLKTIVDRIECRSDPDQKRGVCDFSLDIRLKL